MTISPDVQDFARQDPRGFLADLQSGAVLDEIHRVPELLSYLQPIVDEHPKSGRFILTGSANFALLQSLGQSLAGRTALLELLPLGLSEVRRFESAPLDLFDQLWRGSFPAVYDRGLDPLEWYPSYVSTYLERDVRSVLKVGDLVAFRTFLRLCAGRSGQLLNLSSLGADAGITHGTARAWLSVLEAGYVAWRLPPFHANISKRLIKTPKLHFYDSGLVCYLLGIQSAEQLRTHPLRGAVFETWVAAEVLKSRVHRGASPSLSFYRDRKGLEIDILVESGSAISAIECKSGATVAGDSMDALQAFASALRTGALDQDVRAFVVYGGDARQSRTSGTMLPWTQVGEDPW